MNHLNFDYMEYFYYLEEKKNILYITNKMCINSTKIINTTSHIRLYTEHNAQKIM